MVLHCELYSFFLFAFVGPDLEQKPLSSLIGQNILAGCTSVLSVVTGISSLDKIIWFLQNECMFFLYHTLYAVSVRVQKVLLNSEQI